MKTPFTQEQFFNVFRLYNETVFPMQVIFFLMGIAVIYLTIKPSPLSGRIISGILAFLWLWMGIVYHLVFFTSINKAAYFFGAAFILQGILFLTSGVFKTILSFRLCTGIKGITGSILILFALLVYPASGYLLGHVYPASPTFGLPCPTTIFTFGMLLLTERKIPLVLIIIPFLWSIIGFTAAIHFGVQEDSGLLVAGLLSFYLLRIKKS